MQFFLTFCVFVGAVLIAVGVHMMYGLAEAMIALGAMMVMLGFAGFWIETSV